MLIADKYGAACGNWGGVGGQVEQGGDVGGVDLLDPGYLELQLGEGARRGHRERPRNGRDDCEPDEDGGQHSGRIDDLEHEPHGDAEHDGSDPRGRIADDGAPPALHRAMLRLEITTTPPR